MTDVDLPALLDRALNRRLPLLTQWHGEGTDCYRLFHGTVEGLPGVTVDRYGPQLMIQTFHHSLETEQLQQIQAVVKSQLGSQLGAEESHKEAQRGTKRETMYPDEPEAWSEGQEPARPAGGRWNRQVPYLKDAVRATPRIVTPEILQTAQFDKPLNAFYIDRSDKSPQTIALGDPDETHDEAICHELGVRYRIRGRHRGQDPLLFLDLRAGRRWIQHEAKGRCVLNLFAYTCGMGVCAAHAGASEVVNVDFAQSALAVGRENAGLNGIEAGISFIQSDVFPALRQLAGLPVTFRRRRGVPAPSNYPRLEPHQFELVVLDPPRWAKSPFGTVDLIRDYPSIFKPALLATAPGGRLLCTNNVAQVEREDWLDQLHRSAAKAGRPIKRIELIEPEADFPTFDGQPPLKMAVLEV